MFRVLHIGSHHGNIGDNASHAVVQAAIAERVVASFDNLEIRRFYANAGELRFDLDFALRANRYDLVLFGGGNFLEPVHTYSSTATTLDIAPEVLDALKVPFVLNAVSFDPAKREDPELLDRFRVFAHELAGRERVKVLLRDDGSREDFRRLVGEPEDFGFGVVPDPGLFYEPPQDFPFTDRNFVAANLAGDLEDVRYTGPGERDALFAALRETLAELPDDQALVLVPHVAVDVSIMGDFLRGCVDYASRRRVLVAPLLQGYDDFWKTWAIYRRASGIIANRFHSLVCNVAAEVPLVVLDNYPKITKTLEVWGLTDLAYRGGGSTELLDRLAGGASASTEFRADLLHRQSMDFERSIDEILAFAGA